MTMAQKEGAAGLRDTIRKLAARPQGVSTEDIPDWSKVRVGQQCGNLVERGELYRARRSQMDVRFFASITAAAEYVKAGTVAAPVAIANNGRPRWDESTPVVKAPGFKFTRCPSPEHFGLAAKIANGNAEPVNVALAKALRAAK